MQNEALTLCMKFVKFVDESRSLREDQHRDILSTGICQSVEVSKEGASERPRAKLCPWQCHFDA